VDVRGELEVVSPHDGVALLEHQTGVVARVLDNSLDELAQLTGRGLIVKRPHEPSYLGDDGFGGDLDVEVLL
jgi:hypothetical protein